jgi:hypothetical protein
VSDRTLFFFSADVSQEKIAAHQQSNEPMDLSQLVNPKVTFSKATLEDIIARYNVKNKDSTATVNKTPQSVRTTLSALSHAYARIHGERPDEDHGDLLWLTLDNLKQPSKYDKARHFLKDLHIPMPRLPCRSQSK